MTWIFRQIALWSFRVYDAIPSLNEFNELPRKSVQLFFLKRKSFHDAFVIPQDKMQTWNDDDDDDGSFVLIRILTALLCVELEKLLHFTEGFGIFIRRVQWSFSWVNYQAMYELRSKFSSRNDKLIKVVKLLKKIIWNHLQASKRSSTVNPIKIQTCANSCELEIPESTAIRHSDCTRSFQCIIRRNYEFTLNLNLPQPAISFLQFFVNICRLIRKVFRCAFQFSISTARQ